MPELPEIACRANEIRTTLVGKMIQRVEVVHPKCLNVTPSQLSDGLAGAELRAATNRGKWIFLDTTGGWLLLNLGMGGELLWVQPAVPAPKYRVRFVFTDESYLAVNFWWFGYAHYVQQNHLDAHPMTARLGRGILEVTAEELAAILSAQRKGIKALLLDQATVAGLGNYYIHDILFLARLHPLRKSSTLAPQDADRLHQAIHVVLGTSLAARGAAYEKDLFGRPGGYSSAEHRVAYREGQPCPSCATAVIKLRTGGTHSFLCPRCQPI